MIKREIEITGKTDEKGCFQIYGMSEVKDFFKKFPNHRIVGVFKVFEDKKSTAMLGLYYDYYVPQFQHAFYKLGERLLKEHVDEKLRSMCVVTKKESCVKGKWSHELLKAEDLNNYELVEFLEELKQIAAENFGIEIKDSKFY